MPNAVLGTRERATNELGLVLALLPHFCEYISRFKIRSPQEPKGLYIWPVTQGRNTAKFNKITYKQIEVH